MINENILLAVKAARAALAATEYDREFAVRDLLADLLHYCDETGEDFDNELRVARRNHAEEKGS